MSLLQLNKKYLIFVLPLCYMVVAKIGSNPNVSLGFVLSLLALNVGMLTIVSAPVAAALVFMGHNLIGQITMAHPGLLVQVIPAITLIFGLFYIRRNEIQFSSFNFKNWRRETWALIIILVIFLYGFLHSVIGQDGGFSLSLFGNLVKESQGGKIDYYPYVFMSRWGTFILIGGLCCRGVEELKIFFLAMSVFILTQLIAIPLEVYQSTFGDICYNRINYNGLQALNVNKAYLGYLIAGSFTVFLNFALREKNRILMSIFYVAAMILLILCVVSGSKGPVGAAGLAIIFSVILGGKKYFLKQTIFGASFLFLLLISPKFIGCTGGIENLVKSSVITTKISMDVRADLAKAEFKKTEDHNVLEKLFGGGLGRSFGLVPTNIIDPLTNKPFTVISPSGSHNIFLDFSVDLGWIGVTCFTLASLFLVYSLFKILSSSLMVAAVGGYLIVVCVYSILATAPSMATIQALILGVLFGVGIKKNENLH